MKHALLLITAIAVPSSCAQETAPQRLRSEVLRAPVAESNNESQSTFVGVIPRLLHEGNEYGSMLLAKAEKGSLSMSMSKAEKAGDKEE